jgi:precorrin-6B methylase 2
VETSLAHRFRSAVNAFLFPDFFRLKLATGGMMPVRVYTHLYRQALALPNLDIIEVGAGSGTATIAMALAVRDTGRDTRIISIEKCEGGSRLEHGDVAANLRLLETNLIHFGVRDSVVLYPHAITGDSRSEILKSVRTHQISALVHDADGRIDRDFELFWSILRPGGLIVVDDYENRATFRPVSPRFPDGGTKSLVTFKLLNQFIDWGLVKRGRVIGSTFFGYKPESADFCRFNAERCLDIVRQVESAREAHLATRSGPRDEALGESR